MERKEFLKLSSALFAGGVFLGYSRLAFSQYSGFLKAKKLKKGDKVGLIAPGSAVNSPDDIQYSIEAVKYFGLEPIIAKNLKKGSGYKTRTISERVDDIHDMFLDDKIKAIFAIRGGYGCSQLLDKLDYDLIKSNPKVFAGYSDITALHLAINKFSGLVTFHSPVMMSKFTDFTAENFKSIVLNGETSILRNPDSLSGIRKEYPYRTIIEGSAEGSITGGNLSLISSLMGTKYEIETKGKILLIEDVGEAPYRIDRMLTQLKLSGKLDEAAGIAFGLCEDCTGGSGTWDLSLGEVLDNILGDLNIPVFYGLLIGHTSNQLSFPIGVKGKIDSTTGTVELLESGINL